MKNLNKKLISLAAAVVLSASIQADCTYELFSISSAKGTTIGEYVDQLTSACEYSLVVADSETEKLMDKKLNKTHIKNLTIDEVFEILLTENNLNFTIENDILRISYLKTITYNIDYILSSRKSTGSTDVMLSSTSSQIGQGATGGTSGGMSGASAGGSGMSEPGGSGSNKSGISIESTDEVKFWEELDLELQRVLNRPEDAYQAEAPIINKNAGLITISATGRQQARIDAYLELLQEKVQKQVLIDVSMMSVSFDDKSSTGIDWAQLYALQNFSIAADTVSTNGKWSGTYTPTGNIEDITDIAGRTAGLVQITGGGSINEVIKFLKEQGEVRALSNPKILTLNNQPALITVGTEYFYKIQQSQNQQGAGGGVVSTTQNDIVNSVFAGVLLDITPEISDDDTITIKINPSLSQTRVQIQSDTTAQENRTMPPDLDRRQLSSVVTVKDGNRIILGGLIGSRENFKTNKVPLLGDIPGLGYFFKYEEKTRSVEEIVIVIEPHIIKPQGNTLTIAELGYTSMTKEEAGLKSTFGEDANMTTSVPKAAESKEADEQL
ncbi:MAG: pilus (MSHA type) biogenesis protein MshL [Helicobacteraceae bacterium]|nr:pilus (MSHA type) biogenesis protein MshL [Helicobacteraceae bacterium]